MCAFPSRTNILDENNANSRSRLVLPQIGQQSSTQKIKHPHDNQDLEYVLSQSVDRCPGSYSSKKTPKMAIKDAQYYNWKQFSLLHNDKTPKVNNSLQLNVPKPSSFKDLLCDTDYQVIFESRLKEEQTIKNQSSRFGE